MNELDKIDAVLSLKPGAKFVWVGKDYSGLNWRDDSQTKPTEAEIDAELTRLQTDYANKKYQRDRQAEYPSVVDQLDEIFHNGLDAWKTKIQETKTKYPKP